jgi:hypothetical protein
MSFEQVLSALQGFLGRKVGIGIGDSRAGGPGLVGTIAGTLAGGLEVRDVSGTSTAAGPHPSAPSGTLYFHLQEDETTGVFLHHDHFREAWWDPDGSGHLTIVTGNLRIVVSESEPDEPSASM